MLSVQRNSTSVTDSIPSVETKKNPRDFYAWILLYALYFPLMVSVGDFIAFPRIPNIIDYYIFEEFLINLAINLLFLLPGLVLPILILPCMLILYAALILPTSLYTGCYILYGRRLDYELSEFIWNTNWNQAYEFLRSQLPLGLWVAGAVLLALPFAMMFCVMLSSKPRNTWKRVAFLLLLGTLYGGYHFYIMRLNVQHSLRAWVDDRIRKHFFKTYVKEFYRFKDLYEYEKRTLEIFVRAPKENFPLSGLRSTANVQDLRGIVIVGESASRLHQGIYGYFRNTTPHLSAISSDLFIFDRAEVATAASTRSLLGAFSFIDWEHPTTADYKCSIFDILNKGGFTTYWYTNSVVESMMSFAVGDSFVRLLNSNVQHYVDVKIRNEEGKHLDIGVLPSIEETMATVPGNQSIFVRLMGSHMYYSNRYPEDFAYFRDHPDDPGRPWLTEAKKWVIDTYDNSIRYTDYVVAEIIAAAKRQGGNAFVLYFSDHGEELYQTADFYGRLDGKGPADTPAIRKVPLILWLSEEYKNNFPEIAKAAQTNLHRDFVLDDLIWTMTELYGLTFDGFRSDRSLVNSSYNPANENPE